MNLTIDDVAILESSEVHNLIRKFVTWMFVYEGLKDNTIASYQSGVQYNLSTNNITQINLNHSILTQLKHGITREVSVETPLFNRSKWPFTRKMVQIAYKVILKGAPTFSLKAIHAALCLGLMFLFRKSEYLTDNKGNGKIKEGEIITLLSENVTLWYGDNHPINATCEVIPDIPPTALSMFLPRSKGDPYGKGATRYFPADTGNPNCLVKIIWEYIKEAKLRRGQHLFATPRIIVTGNIIKNVMKQTAEYLNMPAKLSTHSLRIGGLVMMYAANVPDDMKVLAGRWATIRSVSPYARATIEQYSIIAKALNNMNLVQPEHMKILYSKN